MAFSFITRFLGKTTSEAAGYGIGGAIRSPLEPPLQELTNETWRAFVKSGITIPTDPGDAAEIVAEDVALEGWGADQVAQLGLGADQFSKLVDAVRNGPGFGELLQARRRNKLDLTEFKNGLRKLRLQEKWDDALIALLDVLLSPADLANAVVQGHMEQDAAAAEAALQGVDGTRFGVLVENTGLPPGPETLLAWKRRKIVTKDEFETGVREGHTKTKYIPFYEAAERALLSASTYVTAHLKGHATQAEMHAGGGQWGYTPDDLDLWYETEGNPATPHQIHIGYARGAKVPGAANEEDAIRKSVAQGRTRPEYADILYASRYSLPSAFALRGLVTSGDLTAAEGQGILVDSGWDPALATKVADSWAASAGGVATVNPYIAKADTQLWTAIHKAYVKTGVTEAQIVGPLTHIVPDAAARAAIIADWNLERQVQADAPPAA